MDAARTDRRSQSCAHLFLETAGVFHTGTSAIRVCCICDATKLRLADSEVWVDLADQRLEVTGKAAG
jgi:hypothetical protein